MHLHINPHHESPVYRQIQRQIAQAIADREIRPGELLENQQDLAVQLAVSPAAVRKAYRQLHSAGLCAESHDGDFRVTTPDLGNGRAGSTDMAITLLKRELLAQELIAAREVQQRLLPPSRIESNSWTLTSRSYAAGALAGDFFDVVQHPRGVLDIVVADVAGKGLGAGLIMAATKSLIPLVASRRSAALALAELNEKLFPILGQRDFVALVYIRFDPAVGTLEIANAGLPDPYLLRSDGQIEMLTVDGERLPLGIRGGISYSASSISIAPEDSLLLVTDGIPEATDQHGDPLGYDRLGDLLEPNGGESDQWLDRLLDGVSRKTGSLLEDDWTAVLLEYRRPQRKIPCKS